jgi:phage shock protein A
MNWLLDKVEVPEQELESKIKELEETIQQGRESAASYGAMFRRLENEQDVLKKQQDDLVTQAELAIKAGDEDVARKVLTEKVKIAERIVQIEPGIARGRDTFEKLRENLVRLQQQLKEAKLKLRDLQARKRSAEAQKAFDQQLGKTTGAAGNVNFERLEDEVLQAEAEVEIRQEINSDSMSNLELAEKSRNFQVEAELEALKDKLESE